MNSVADEPVLNVWNVFCSCRLMKSSFHFLSLRLVVALKASLKCGGNGAHFNGVALCCCSREKRPLTRPITAQRGRGCTTILMFAKMFLSLLHSVN